MVTTQKPEVRQSNIGVLVMGRDTENQSRMVLVPFDDAAEVSRDIMRARLEALEAERHGDRVKAARDEGLDDAGQIRRVYVDIGDVVQEFLKEIKEFMRGGLPPMHRENPDGTEAHLWVSAHHSKHAYRDPARHIVFETLVIEPYGASGSSQYEVAVRMPTARNDHGGNTEYVAGYVASSRGIHPYGVDH